jgi:hypothetical protein
MRGMLGSQVSGGRSAARRRNQAPLVLRVGPGDRPDDLAVTAL